MSDGFKARSPTPEQVREEIERAREQIASSALAFKQEMAARTDWREWVRRRPGWILLGAVAVGFLLGFRPRR